MVSILVGAILQSIHSKKVELINGKLNHCYHTWLSVDGEHVDPCLDCTLETNYTDFVRSAIAAEYVPGDIVTLNTGEFYPGLTLMEIIDVCSHKETQS